MFCCENLGQRRLMKTIPNSLVISSRVVELLHWVSKSNFWCGNGTYLMSDAETLAARAIGVIKGAPVTQKLIQFCRVLEEWTQIPFIVLLARFVGLATKKC